MKKHLIHFILLLVTPIALYINFFIADKYLWKMEIKAWIYYSLFITLSKIIIIIICNVIMFKYLSKQNYWNKEKISGFNNMTTTAFLLANFYFIFPMHQFLWLYVPLFSFSTILVVGYLYFRIQNGEKVTLKYLLYVKKSDIDEKYNTKILIITALLFMFFHGMAQWLIVKHIFNPYHKSLEYFMGHGIKVGFGK